MNNSQLQDWFSVMRDPKSGKCKGRLQDVTNPNDRCCLGHLGFSMGVTTGIKVDKCDNEYVAYFYGGRTNGIVLPSALAKELDMTQCGDFVEVIEIGDAEYCSMSVINDETDLTMAEIADVIEAQFKAGNVTRYPSEYQP